MIRLRIFILAAVGMLTACGGPQPIAMSSSVNLTDSAELPTPTNTDYSRSGLTYLVGAYDKIAVDVLGIEDLTRELQVDAGGTFEFPIVGTIEAAGRTPAEISTEIERRLRANYFRDPQVTVNLLDGVSQRVTVDGQVKKPGLYPAYGEMTLIRAVAAAEGLAEYADVEDVVIIRSAGGQKYAGLYNLGAIRRGNYDDPKLYANDIVIVGDSSERRLFDTLLRAAPLITTPIIVLTR